MVQVLTARQLEPEHGPVLGGGAVPSLVSELVLTLRHRHSGSVLDAGQQEPLPTAQLALPGAQREAGAAQLLRNRRRGHPEPPARKRSNTPNH